MSYSHASAVQLPLDNFGKKSCKIDWFMSYYIGISDHRWTWETCLELQMNVWLGGESISS